MRANQIASSGRLDPSHEQEGADEFPIGQFVVPRMSWMGGFPSTVSQVGIPGSISQSTLSRHFSLSPKMSRHEGTKVEYSPGMVLGPGEESPRLWNMH